MHPDWSMLQLYRSSQLKVEMGHPGLQTISKPVNCLSQTVFEQLHRFLQVVKDCISGTEPEVLIFASFRMSSLIDGFVPQTVIDSTKYLPLVVPIGALFRSKTSKSGTVLNF